MIIGIVGTAQSGKDTVASLLINIFKKRKIHFNRVSFAGGLKLMFKPLFPDSNTEEFKILKQYKDFTGRDLLEHLGKSMLKLDQDFWIDVAFKDVDITKDNIIFTDVRKTREAEKIKEAGGILIKVTRETKMARLHSERYISRIKTDYEIENMESLVELANKVSIVANKIYEKTD